MDWNCNTPTLRTEDALRERIERRERLAIELRTLDNYIFEVRRADRLVSIVDNEADLREEISAHEESSLAMRHSWRPGLQ